MLPSHVLKEIGSLHRYHHNELILLVDRNIQWEDIDNFHNKSKVWEKLDF